MGPVDTGQAGARYQLGDVIGRGTTGVVYRAVSMDDGSYLAVKVLHSHLLTDARATSRFIQERQVLGRLDHPNVVRVIELVQGDELSIVMELVEGGDLKELQARSRLSPSQAVRLASRLADALTALHSAGVVHRDLKPANVLVHQTDEGPVPRITDFGLARLVEEGMSQSSAAVGTPLYMAPEAATRKETVGPPADVYSLGIMLYELLVGQPPFVGGGQWAIITAHCSEQPPLVGAVPADLRALIDQMLAKDPTVRPSAAEVRDRLGGVEPLVDDSMAPVPIEESPDETVARLRPWAAPGPSVEEPSTGSGSTEVLAGSEDADATHPRFEPRFDPPTTTDQVWTGRLVARVKEWQTKWMIVGGILVAAVLVLAAIPVLSLRGHDDVPGRAVEYGFSPELLDGGGVVTRQWTLAPDGSHLEGELTVVNAGQVPLTATYMEILPTSLGIDLTDVAFDPSPTERYDEELAAGLPLDGLEVGGEVILSYKTEIEPGEATQERLASLAQDQVAAARAWFAQHSQDHEAPSAVTIAKLSIAPPPADLSVGDELDLVVTGELADGSPATAAMLSSAAWSTDNASVASVTDGHLVARASGDTTITVQVGEIRGSAAIHITEPLIASPVADKQGPTSDPTSSKPADPQQSTALGASSTSSSTSTLTSTSTSQVGPGSTDTSPRSVTVSMPDVTGMDISTALSLLTNAGLQADVTVGPSSQRSAQTVISQSPAAGSNLARGSRVSLVQGAGQTGSFAMSAAGASDAAPGTGYTNEGPIGRLVVDNVVGGPVTVSVQSGPCTLQGTLVGAGVNARIYAAGAAFGLCTFRAVQESTADYAAAPPKTTTLKSVPFGQFNLAASPLQVGVGQAFTVSANVTAGGPVTIKLASGPCVKIDGTNWSGTAPGVCAFTGDMLASADFGPGAHTQAVNVTIT